MLICVLCFFQLGIFIDVKTFCDFTVCFRHVTSEWQLFSVSISGMSILAENWGCNFESWSDTLIKQFNNDINITWTKANLNIHYSVALLHKIILLGLAAILGKPDATIRLKPVSWLCSFSHSELKPNCEWCKLPNSAKHNSSRSYTLKLRSLRTAKW